MNTRSPRQSVIRRHLATTAETVNRTETCYSYMVVNDLEGGVH
jgi:hypothetical protein